MPAYARPRLTLVIDEDIEKLIKDLAELDQRPVATYAAMLLSDVVRQLALEKGLITKKLTTTTEHKT